MRLAPRTVKGPRAQGRPHRGAAIPQVLERGPGSSAGGTGAVSPAFYVWQREHIEEGVRQADAGEFASEAEVREAFARWRR